MPPKRRALLSSRPRLSAAVAGPSSSRGWLSFRRGPSKRPERLVDDGTPLTDEILVTIFASLPEIADLVRCSAACRRWRRLVSSEAAFICRTPRRPGRFIPCLALGFFHLDAAGSAPRFAPTASAARLLGLRQPSLNTLVEGLDGAVFDSSLLVASRNGLVVVQLRRGKHNRALKLCVCNPMTGELSILPPLNGKDSLGYYACTVLTADDHDSKNSHPPCSPSAYRLLLVYSRRGFTAFRSYSSEDGSWSPEAKVTNARLGKKQMGLTRGGVVIPGGKVVYWLVNSEAFRLHVDTSQAAVVCLPWVTSRFCVDVANTLLGVSADGRLCAIRIEELFLIATARQPRSVVFRVSTLGDAVPLFDGTPPRSKWERKELIQVQQFLPAEVTRVMPRWFCEKSGVVFFTAEYSDQRSEVYALSLEKKVVEKVASHDGTTSSSAAAVDPWGNLHGYEMGRAAYLATLGEGDAAEEISD